MTPKEREFSETVATVFLVLFVGIVLVLLFWELGEAVLRLICRPKIG